MNKPTIKHDRKILLASIPAVSTIMLFFILMHSTGFSKDRTRETQSTDITELLKQQVSTNKKQHQTQNIAHHYRLFRKNNVIEALHNYVSFWPEVEEL